MRSGAIILAAGSSQRMGGKDKLLVKLAGRPVIGHSIACFAAVAEIEQLVIVVSQENQDEVRRIAKEIGVSAELILGGARRQDSVAAGLGALREVDCVVVHDGARPLVSSEHIGNAIAGAGEFGAALCAIPVVDTVKRTDDSGLVRSTVNRADLRLSQTPQAFRREVLLRAHELVRQDATDDAAMVELIGEPVRLVAGSTNNIKVTTEADLVIAEALLRDSR